MPVLPTRIRICDERALSIHSVPGLCRALHAAPCLSGGGRQGVTGPEDGFYTASQDTSRYMNCATHLTPVPEG